MKIIFFLISFMLIISCSNKKSFNNKESLVDEITVKEYSSNSVVKEKFLEFYDLNILLENNPQFTENIKERLNHFKLDSSKVLYLQKTSKIKDIKIIKHNSETTFKILFNLETGNLKQRDSVLAKFFEEEIIIEDTITKSTKVKFSRFN
ncbi:hypothetical protein [Polaribacter sp. Hel_I_88]|uniref:hypothetical protein n=1 Tax=Polaribacter sp. Hel_I_88 TaxID=1250006 RepID=UPI00047AA82B|nr:hypothetical protein [Polaribacter sp. Hel_I_88]